MKLNICRTIRRLVWVVVIAITITTTFPFFTVHATDSVSSDDPVYIYLFHSESCPHCKKERSFLETYTQANPEIIVKEFEISDPENAQLLLSISHAIDTTITGVPVTIIGNRHIVGFNSAESTGKQIMALVSAQKTNPKPDIVSEIINTGTYEGVNTLTPSTTTESITIPVFGEIVPATISLPVLTIIIAGVDGFNPCAMWVLLFLISLLVGMKNRWRMWTLGSAFILASGVVYFLFLAAWLNVVQFLNVITWIRVAIGLFALGVGIYYLYEYISGKAETCKVSGGTKRQEIFNKLKHSVQEKHFVMALLGIILLAFAINLVEAVCSVGLPAIYTQVLSMTPMPSWQYYAYLLLYVLVFMLDDLIIFIIAMITVRAAGINTKYAKYSRLIGGLVLLLLGLAMIFKPELITFG